MSQFNLIYTDESMDTREALTLAKNLGIELFCSTKIIKGKEHEVYYDYYGSIDIIGEAKDYFMCKSFDDYIEKFKNKPQIIDEIKKRKDFPSETSQLPKEMCPREKQWMYEAFFFDEEIFKIQLASKDFKKLRELFDSLKRFITEMLKRCSVVCIIHYEEHGLINETELTTTNNCEIKLCDFNIDDVIFMTYNSKLKILK